MYHTILEDQRKLDEIRCFRDQLNRTIKPHMMSRMSPILSTSPPSTHLPVQQQPVDFLNLQASPPAVSPIDQSQAAVHILNKQHPQKCDVGNLNRAHSKTLSHDPYSCEFLSQLQGGYQTETCEINVVVTPSTKWRKQYAIVERVSSNNQKKLLYQLIYDEGSRFRLCSSDGQGIALMSKGVSMHLTVVWTGKDGVIVWQRKGTVVFDFVNIVPLTQPIAQLKSREISTIPTQRTMSSSDLGCVDVQMKEKSESEQEITLKKPTLSNLTSGSTCTSEESYKRFITKAQKEEAICEKIKSYCRVNPTLLDKLIDWARSEYPSITAGQKTTDQLSKGRIWVSSSLDLSACKFDKQWQVFVDDLKGAYQELKPGIYYQPRPEKNELGVQHRLRKSFLDLWLIEEIDMRNNTWIPCAQELKNGQWVDLKNSRRMIKVQLVPILNVLQKIESVSKNPDAEKYLDFLFTACNQRKLIQKLKSRNLKHNIANLQFKLQKQYALSFAIKVARTADSIAFIEQGVL